MIRQFGLMVMVLIMCCTGLVKGQYTNTEMVQTAYEECTAVKLRVKPATNSMLRISSEFNNMVYYQLAWAEQLNLTPAEIAAIESLKTQGETLIAAFEQLWHGDNFEINPSGLSEGYIWVYSFPELSNYQYMFAWYNRGVFCMSVWPNPFNPDGLYPEAIDSFSQAQIRMENYIRHCEGLTGQLNDIIAQLNTFTPP